MQVNSINNEYKNKFTPDQLRHLLLNWSNSELGLHHSELPVGYVIRDQGQFDIFSGNSILQLNMDGIGNIQTDRLIEFKSPYILLNSLSPDTLIFKNRIFTSSSFNKKKTLFIKDKIDGYYLMNDETQADPSTGIITPKIPLSDVFDVDSILTDFAGLPDYMTETYKVWES